MTTDRYGRKIPKHAHGTANLQNHTSSAITVVEKTLELYDRIINPDLLIRRIYVTACHVRTEQEAQKEQTYEQMSLFDFAEETEEQKAQKQALQKENRCRKPCFPLSSVMGKCHFKRNQFQRRGNHAAAQRTDWRTSGMNRLENTHRYDDIIDLPHPVSKKHPQMPSEDRAAQFSPFAALTGYERAIREKKCSMRNG